MRPLNYNYLIINQGSGTHETIINFCTIYLFQKEEYGKTRQIIKEYWKATYI